MQINGLQMVGTSPTMTGENGLHGNQTKTGRPVAAPFP